jgi:hypothetical protein
MNGTSKRGATIRYRCAACGSMSRAALSKDLARFACSNCSRQTNVPKSVFQGEHLVACARCGCPDLFSRKDFSPRLGLAIVIAGALASGVAWAYYRQYLAVGILLMVALLDLAFYHLVGAVVQCYACHAQHRHLGRTQPYIPFNLETHEKYRGGLRREG